MNLFEVDICDLWYRLILVLVLFMSPRHHSPLMLTHTDIASKQIIALSAFAGTMPHIQSFFRYIRLAVGTARHHLACLRSLFHMKPGKWKLLVNQGRMKYTLFPS